MAEGGIEHKWRDNTEKDPSNGNEDVPLSEECFATFLEIGRFHTQCLIFDSPICAPGRVDPILRHLRFVFNHFLQLKTRLRGLIPPFGNSEEIWQDSS